MIGYIYTIEKSHPHELDRKSCISRTIKYLVYCANYHVECECIVMILYIPSMRDTHVIPSMRSTLDGLDCRSRISRISMH